MAAPRSLMQRGLDHPGESRRLEVYERTGGYRSVRKALGMDPAKIIDEVKASGLRGRGGAGFPTGTKWSFTPRESEKPKYLVCNADESEPGSFKDRLLMERGPHQLLEGLLIGAFAIGAEKTFVYIRGEYAEAARVLQGAIDDLRDWVGYLGDVQTKTPNLDRLAKRGLSFTRSYCAAPVCNPSRTALLSGFRPSGSGVYGNGTDWRKRRRSPSSTIPISSGSIATSAPTTPATWCSISRRV